MRKQLLKLNTVALSAAYITKQKGDYKDSLHCQPAGLYNLLRHWNEYIKQIISQIIQKLH